eukprot:2763611-Prymnesium_polylepis.1
MQARPVLAASPLSETGEPTALPRSPMRPPDDDLVDLTVAALHTRHVRIHASANATAVESREEIAMESGFSRPLERNVQKRADAR